MIEVVLHFAKMDFLTKSFTHSFSIVALQVQIADDYRGNQSTQFVISQGESTQPLSSCKAADGSNCRTQESAGSIYRPTRRCSRGSWSRSWPSTQRRLGRGQPHGREKRCTRRPWPSGLRRCPHRRRSRPSPARARPRRPREDPTIGCLPRCRITVSRKKFSLVGS